MRQPLKDLAAICAGQGAPQGDHNYCENGTPFVKAGNLQELLEGKAITSIQKVSDEVAKKHKLRLYPKGTILFAKSGMSCMKGYIYVLPQSAYVVSHLACITPNEDISEYLRYYFNYHKPNHLVKDAAYPSISLSDVGNLVVDMKPESERNEIVSVLQHTESIITLRQQQLQKLNELVKARFVELFGDPVSNPKAWEKVPLGKRCEIVTGNTPSRAEPENYGEFIEWIKSDNINTPFTFVTRAQEYLSEAGFKKCRFVEAGSLLMTCIAGSINCIGNVAVTDRRVAFNQQINAIVPEQDEVLYLYWLMLLSKPAIHGTINMALKGILSKGQLAELTFPFPPIELQNQFAAFVEQIDKSKVAVQKALDEAQLLFDSLMQKYFE